MTASVDSSAAPPRWLGAGVALLSVAMMTSELVLTRVFSVIIWYHFAFFAISVALFGTGAAAVFVHVKQDDFVTERAPGVVARAAALFAVAIVAVDFVLVNHTPDWFGGPSNAPFTALTSRLFFLFLIVATPFFLGGFAVSLAMTRYAKHIHRLYFWDLGGAGAACAMVVPVLAVLGGPRALVFAGAVALASAACFAKMERSEGRTPPTRALVLGAAGIAIGILLSVTGALDVKVGKGIDLRRLPPEYNRWNSFSMVTVLPGGFRGWGMSPAYTGPVPDLKTLVIDLNAATVLTRFDGQPDHAGPALFDLSAIVYRIRAGSSDVCIIGAGGGKDVLAALAAGTRRVTAAEINPLIVDGVVRGAFRDFTGGLYFRPDVDVHVEDGRAFVRSTRRTFDVILLSMVDTSAATAAGAYVLTENSLYTTDAFSDFFSRLSADGVLSVSTVSLPGLAVGARLVAVARAALERRGANPARSIAVIDAPWIGSEAVLHDVLVKPGGFSPQEVETLDSAAHVLGFSVAYLPDRPVANRTGETAWIGTVATATDDRALAREMSTWPVDVSAVGDGRPFFFYQNRLGDFFDALFSSGPSHLFGNGLVVLAKVLLIAVVLVLVFLLGPLFFARAELRDGEGSVARDLAYVSCLGLGFMFVEIAVLQRFTLYLGHPTYTLAVVLLVLLASGGVGSRVFASVTRGHRDRRLATAIGALIVYLTLLAFVAPTIFEATLGAPPPARAVVVGLLLLPLGFLLGMPFPAGLARVSERAPRRLPWLWAVNSATSVLGSVLATLVSLHAGIAASLGVGGALYFGALVLSTRMSVSRATVPRAERAGALGG